MWTRRNFLAHFVTRMGAGFLFVRSGFCQQETIFEKAMISDGDNSPSLNIRANRITEICVALQHRKALALIEHDLGISPEELRGKIDSLVTEGLVKKSLSGRFLPTFMVVTIEDAKWMAPPADRLPDIRVRAESIPAIRQTGFSRSAFSQRMDVSVAH